MIFFTRKYPSFSPIIYLLSPVSFHDASGPGLRALYLHIQFLYHFYIKFSPIARMPLLLYLYTRLNYFSKAKRRHWLPKASLLAKSAASWPPMDERAFFHLQAAISMLTAATIIYDDRCFLPTPSLGAHHTPFVITISLFRRPPRFSLKEAERESPAFSMPGSCSSARATMREGSTGLRLITRHMTMSRPLTFSSIEDDGKLRRRQPASLLYRALPPSQDAAAKTRLLRRRLSPTASAPLLLGREPLGSASSGDIDGHADMLRAAAAMHARLYAAVIWSSRCVMPCCMILPRVEPLNDALMP